MTEQTIEQPVDEQPVEGPEEAPVDEHVDEPTDQAGEEHVEGKVVDDDEQPAAEPMQPSTEMVKFAGPQGLLTIDPTQTRFTDTQRVALYAIGILTTGDDAVPAPFVAQFLHTCQAAGLDPWRKEAYLITYGKRVIKNNRVYDNRKFSLVTGIDGFRKRGAATGDYRGQTPPQWCGDDGVWQDIWPKSKGAPTAARVGIMRALFDAPVYGVVMFEELAAYNEEWIDDPSGKTGADGKVRRVKGPGRALNETWARMPAGQLAKCAEAAGWRKAYPGVFSGIYASEEMDQARAQYEDSERDLEVAQRRRQESIDTSNARLAAANPRNEPDVVVGSIEPVNPDRKSGEPVPFAEALAVTRDNLAERAESPRKVRAEHQTGMSDEQRLAYLDIEAREQAVIMGTTLDGLFGRDVTLKGIAYADFDAPTLQGIVARKRPMVAGRLRAQGKGAEADAYDEVRADQALPLDLLFGT